MSFPAGVQPQALVSGDFNGDGRVDIAVADRGDLYTGAGAGVSILLGNGDGTFSPPQPVPAGTFPDAIVAADFTGDGIIDLAVANSTSEDISILRGNGFGGFEPLQTIPLGDDFQDQQFLIAGNFTGGGAIDLAVASGSTGDVLILKGDGHGDFQPAQLISLADGSNALAAIAAGDFAGDGKSELAAVTSGNNEPDRLLVLANEGNGTLTLQQQLDLGDSLGIDSIAIGHYFGGPALDFAMSSRRGGAVTLVQGDGRGGFSNVQAFNVGNDVLQNAITSGDFTGDGLSDLAIATLSPNSALILLNQGSGQFAQPGALSLAPHNTPVVADFTGDGLPDVAVASGTGDILFRQGLTNQSGEFGSPVVINPGRPRAISRR